MRNISDVFCPNEECHARGHQGKGNIQVHSRKEHRWLCKECGKTFSDTKGTPLYRLKKDIDWIQIALVLLSHGAPVIAIVKAFCVDRRTVERLESRIGKHCEMIHGEEIAQKREHPEVQVDEMWVKTRKGSLWLAMALATKSRLWLGATVGKRDRKLIRGILFKVKSCITSSCLIVTDGLSTYRKALMHVFSSKVPREGKKGRSKKQREKGILMVQLVKSYSRQGKRWVCHGAFYLRLVAGNFQQVSKKLQETKTKYLNTSYIERLNATFRQRMAPLARRSRNILQRDQRLLEASYFMGTFYNFCCVHQSLNKTPAMAAGITQKVWAMEDLLFYRKFPDPWRFPKKRGRKSKSEQMIIEKWGRF